MSIVQIITFFVSLLSQTVHSASSPTNQALELTDETFTDLGKFKNALVLFYAPWCSHCKRLKPEFDQAAKILAKNDPPVLLAKVDCTAEGRVTCSRQGISGYPTLRIYVDGKYQKDYDGARRSKPIVDEMKTRAVPLVRILRNLKELENFLKDPTTLTKSSTKCLVVGFLKEESDLDFERFAKIFKRKAHFARILDDINPEKVVVFLPKVLRNLLESDSYDFDVCTDHDLLDGFIRAHCYGLVGIRTADNHQDFDRKVNLIVVYFDVNFEKNSKYTSKIRDLVLKIAHKYQNETVTFALSPRGDFDEELRYFDLSKNEKIVVIGWKDFRTSYLMEMSFGLESFEEFVVKFLNCSLLPTIKSEHPPKVQNLPVKVAVGSTFDALVTDNPKDVLIMFYAPWCERSKVVSAIFDDVGEKLKAERDVDLVKIDASVNDYPAIYRIDSYPTIYWLSKIDKNVPLLYRGPLEFDNILNLVVRRAATELKGFKRDGKKKSTSKSAKIEL